MVDNGHVFISYARKDGRDYAARLDLALRDYGFRTWRDTRDIDPHQDFSAEIEKALDDAAHVIVCITEDTRRPDSFVRREVIYAHDILSKAVTPLRFADVPPPLSIVNLTWIDGFDREWNATFADVLLRLLRERVRPHSEQNTTIQQFISSVTGHSVQIIGSQINYEKLPPAPAPSPLPEPAPPRPPDPYKRYLERLLKEVVSYLKQTVFSREVIPLRAEDTPEAVDAPTALSPLAYTIAGIGAAGERTEYANFAHAFDEYDGRLLLLGEPGAGKSTTLYAHARDAITARLDDPSLPLPFVMPIVTWDAYKRPSLVDWLAATITVVKRDDITRVIDDGEALLLLDGLDELGAERPVNPKKPDEGTFDPRLRFMELVPEANRVLVSCRVKDYEQIGGKLRLDGAVTLQPLTDAQMQQYLRDVTELWDALQADDDLREVARTPILLSYFAVAFQELKREGTLADELRDLRGKDKGDIRDKIFEVYIQSRYQHEARKPNADLPYTLDELTAALGRLAMRNVGNRLREDNVFQPSNFAVLEETDSVELIELTIRLHLLALRADGETYRFPHLLLRDHFAYKGALAALGDPNYDVRSTAARALGELGDARAVDPLIAALGDPDWVVRHAAARALGQLGDARAVEPLIAMLRDPHEDVRLFAAGALIQIGEPAVEPLIAALRDLSKYVRYQAAEALGGLGDERAVEPLIAALGDPNYDARRAAAEALIQIGEPAVEPLIAALRDPDEDVRYAAANALRELGDPRAVDPLIAALLDLSEYVRGEAATALGRLGDPRAVAPLIAALGDPDRRVRRAAAWALWGLGDARAVAPLIAALRDPHANVRRFAARALGRLGDPRAVDPLIAALRDPDALVRLFAAGALGRLGNKRAVDPLIAALRDPDYDARSEAAEALGQLGDARAVAPLIDLLADETQTLVLGRVCDRAAEALENIGTEEALAAVRAWRGGQ